MVRQSPAVVGRTMNEAHSRTCFDIESHDAIDEGSKRCLIATGDDCVTIGPSCFAISTLARGSHNIPYPTLQTVLKQFTMKFVSSGVLLLATTCHAYVANHGGMRGNTLHPLVSKRTVVQRREIMTPTTVSYCGVSSKLSMGVMEDFISGTDEKARKASNDKYLAQLQTRVDRINSLEPTIEDLGDDELVEKTQEFRDRLKNGEDMNGSLLEEAFAVVREAAW